MPPATEIGTFDYLDTQDVECLMIRQHCNGLLLLGEEEVRVLNPATRQWACLPPPPPMCTPGMEDIYDVNLEDRCTDCHEQYLVFDPTESPYYEVFLVRCVPWIPSPDSYHLVAPHIAEREWPPSTFVLLVLSSRTNRWEERPFVRQGEAARTIGYMLEAFPSEHPYAVYWRGSIYIRRFDFVMRISLSSHKYQVIELPESLRRNWYCLRLGKSENGVYCALHGRDVPGLQIWYLDETCYEINWMLKCDVNLHPLLANFSWEHSDSPSSVQCANCNEDDRSNATCIQDGSGRSHIRYPLLGFHPNKNIAFFHTPLKRVLAYYFDSSKIEDFGCLPMEPQDRIYLSFPYTPLSDKRHFKQQVA
ncbi:unnamed protein product [Alopecurus aequalis]